MASSAAGGHDPHGGEESPQGLSGETVLNRLAAAVAQLAQATASSSASSSNQWRETKYVKTPDIFNPKSVEEETNQWQEWSFHFKNFMTIQDSEFRQDFEKCESAASFVAFENYATDVKERALRLYAVLASFLRGRPLKLLRATTSGDGFAVWRRLCACRPVLSRN